MNESNSMKAIDKTILSEQGKFRLSEIIEIENYFYQEINKRKSSSKKLSKYVTAFDYIDKILLVLSASTGGVSNRKKITEHNKKQKEKNMIKFLCWLKLNSIAMKH